ncbi:ATPase AAA domain-containing protein 5 [Tyrophagus putrescentiae]|nr:ATPase AAA domain-containing protein 5 [Tyrophagus putrescentiae]
MSQPQQQQLQQQSKITAFFTARNSVLADEDKSLITVKDAKSSKLQTFPPAKLPKTDAQHVTAFTSSDDKLKQFSSSSSSSSSSSHSQSAQWPSMASFYADIPVITLESSDNDQREAVLKTEAANQRPALPPPNYLKLWTSTYRPKSTEELVGQKEAVDAARCWLANWQTTFAQPAISNVSLALPSYIQTNKSTATTTEMINANATTLGKCLLLCGPSGVGKTALVYALAGESGYQVLEFSATSQRLTPALVLKEMNDSLQSHYIAANHHHKDVINRNGNDNDNEHLSTAASATAAAAKKLQGLNIFQRAKSGGNSADSAAGNRMQLLQGVLYEDYHGNSGNKQNKNDITKTRNTREKKTAELWRTLQAAENADARKPIIITCSLRDGSFLCDPVDWLPHLRSHLAGLLSSSSTQKQIEETKKSNRKDDRCDEVDQKTVESTTTLKLSSARLDTGVYGRRFSGDVRQAVNQLQFWMAGKESDSSSSQGDTAPIIPITSTPSSYLAYLDLCSVEDVYRQSLEGRRWAVSQDIDYYDAHLFDDRRLDFGGLHPLQSYQQNEHWSLNHYHHLYAYQQHFQLMLH